jgi:Mg-chelatase subunit ChlD
LIEASHLTKGERDALVKGITAILDQLRSSDEAFILTFSDELVFEQDLTHSPWLLQDAMSHLKPRSGESGLYDAIATSAAHLRRIAKNQNRVLLLISDGQYSESKDATLDLAWSVREVTVHCMGVDVSSDRDRRFLDALASRTGGRTVYVQDVRQFPAMSQEMAKNIYGPMQ